MGEVNEALEDEITERLEMAGIQVLEARIGYLAYAPEIASSMLKDSKQLLLLRHVRKL